MAQLNMDCVRDLLQYLEANMRCRENGRIVRIKMKHIRHQMPNTSYEELYEAARYLVSQKLVTCEGGDKGKEPSQYVFNSITPKGHELMQAMRDDTLWNKCKKQLPSLVLSKGADALIQFLVALAVQ